MDGFPTQTTASGILLKKNRLGAGSFYKKMLVSGNPSYKKPQIGTKETHLVFPVVEERYLFRIKVHVSVIIKALISKT